VGIVDRLAVETVPHVPMGIRVSDWAGTGYETGMMATQVFD
jgi:hypothetical protein